MKENMNAAKIKCSEKKRKRMCGVLRMEMMHAICTSEFVTNIT